MEFQGMRVAIVHYWIVNWRGGEKVLKAVADLFPQADIFTHVADPELVERELPGRSVHTTFISKLPFASRHYQKYLPLMPLALEQLDLRGYDLVISSEAGPAKGVISSPSSVHVCYCHSPMRYVWDMYPEYRAQARLPMRLVMAPLLHWLRVWDQVSAQRVDHYAANSRFVAQRIRKYYRREADVIYPPVSVDKFRVSGGSDDFFLWVGQLVRYKRPDLAIDAFNELGYPLVVIGDGELSATLRKKAKGNIRILGRQPEDVIIDHYARCRALIFPGIEDFGIVPVEAMASGKPVIAYAAGGALETVVDGVTGMLFEEQTVESLMGAVRSFVEGGETFDAPTIRNRAVHFSSERFALQFGQFLRMAVDRP